MSDAFAPRPEHKFSFGLWTVGNRGRDPFGDVVRDPLPPDDAVALLAEVGRLGRQPARQRPRADRRHARRARSHCPRLQATPAGARHRRADGDRQSVLRSGVPRRRVHVERRARARLRGAEDDDGDGPRRGAGRAASSCCGAAARERRPTRAGAPDEAIKRLREAVNYLCEYSIDRGYGFQLCARGEAERAARRHLHGDDRRVSRLHPDARSSRDGGRESGSRPRTAWRASTSCTRSRRRGKRESCFTST